MGQVKNNEATRKYCMHGILIISAVMVYVEMYQRYMILGPICHKFASLFLT